MDEVEPRVPACRCWQMPLSADQYDVHRAVGTDPTNGRFGEVTILNCRTCGQLWLRYQVEYEGFSRSARFFMGPISPDTAAEITAAAAIPWLGSLAWYLFGGSYFDGQEGKTTGPLYADL